MILLTAIDRMQRRPTQRLVSVRPRSRDELRRMLIDPHRGVMMIPTLSALEFDERVVLDVRLPECQDGVVLRTRVSYTFPERKGPFFACRRDDVAALHRFLDDRRASARAHRRYPALINSTLRVNGRSLRAQLTDLSMVGARFAVIGDVAVGDPLTIQLENGPSLLPRRLSGTAILTHGGTVSVRFGGPETEAWRRLRRVLRRADETGLLPRLS